MAGRGSQQPVGMWSWVHGDVTVSKSGVVRLDGKRIGRVAQLNVSMFGAWARNAEGHELGVRCSPPPATLEAAAGAVYDEYVTTVLGFGA